MPRDHDRDVALGLEPGEADHVVREIDDAHGIAHVEHEHVAAAADAAGLHDQLRGLVDRHEVARHLGAR